MNEQKNMMVEDQKRFVLPQMIGMDGGDDDLADDMEGLQLSFPQIKVPGGGSLVWELPSGDPQNPNYEKYLEGVILFSHNSNAYWPEGSEYDDNVPPLCQSVDGKEGYGEPGGLCLDCLQNQYGSSQKGAGKACKNMRTIYLLRSGELMPYRMDALLETEEFRSLGQMKRMCRACAEPTSDPTEFNLYGETASFYIWIRAITREKDYNLYVHFYLKNSV